MIKNIILKSIKGKLRNNFTIKPIKKRWSLKSINKTKLTHQIERKFKSKVKLNIKLKCWIKKKFRKLYRQ